MNILTKGDAHQISVASERDMWLDPNLSWRDALISQTQTAMRAKLVDRLKDSERLEWLVKAQCVLITDFDGLVFPYWHTSGRRGEAKPTVRDAIDAAMEGKTK